MSDERAQRDFEFSNKRRNPLNNISNSISYKRTKLKVPTMTTVMMQNTNSFGDSNKDIIYENKIKKQNQLKLLQSNIWENQKILTNLKIRYDDLQTNISSSKRNLELLQLSISSLNTYKLEKSENLQSEFKTFKKELQTQLDEKIDRLNQHYEKIACEIIEKKQVKFRNVEKSLLNQIKILQCSIDEDFSDVKTKEKQLEVEQALKEELDNLMELKSKEITSLEERLDKQKIEIQQMKENIVDLENKLALKSKPKVQTLEKELVGVETEYEGLRMNEIELNEKLTELNTLNQNETDKLLALKEEARGFQNDLITFDEQIRKEEQYRRFLHEKLQELKGNIRVFCRIKPDDPNQVFQYNIQSSTDLKETLVIQESKIDSIMSSQTVKKSHMFSFDKIFDTTYSNGDIFQEISQLVQSSLDGFNVCIFTYGQTGSGKTFTMSNIQDGLIPRSLNLMFSKLNETDSNLKLYGQFFEIYGDTTKDLIAKNFTKSIDESEVEMTNTDLNNIKLVELTSIEQINELLEHANKKRTTAATMANDVSSRSHSIFKVYITKFNNILNKNSVISTLNLIDLAGSERLNRSKVTGDRLKETLSINKSLSSLGDVISSLKSNSTHIPYRNSKLTYLLKDSLGGNSKTLMFVNISCLNSHLTESLSSLRFANKVNETVLK